MTQPLQMLRATIDIRSLHRWMGFRGLRDYDVSMHCLTTETLTPQMSPKPFRFTYDGRGTWGTLYGYCRASEEELRHAVMAFADPLQAQVIKPDSIHTKMMPAEWAAGTDMQFEVRVKPVKRRREDNGNGSIKTSERDAYMSQLEKEPDLESTREEVYAQWTAENILRLGGAVVKQIQTISSQMAQTARHGKGVHTIHGPDATVRGIMTVTDSDKFNDLIARGIGRHRTYGYGMIMLEPMSRDH